MKPTLKEAYSPGWNGMPMKMSPRDLELWIRFQNYYFDKFDRFYFDVLVGEPVIETTYETEAMKAMIEQSSRLRIDAVGERKDEYWLIEFRPNAAPGAIGSILTYKTLWEAEPLDDRIVTPVIVTDNTNRNITKVAAILNIILILV